MSIAHRLEEDEIEEATVSQLYERLGERDSTMLYQQSYRLFPITTFRPSAATASTARPNTSIATSTRKRWTASSPRPAWSRIKSSACGAIMSTARQASGVRRQESGK